MKKDNKGFTLIELLAVILILAIIAIITVPRVLSSVDSAKMNSLLVESRKIANEALTKVASDELEQISRTTLKFKLDSTNGGGTYYCYTMDDLGITSGGKYYGKAIYGPLEKEDEASVYVVLSDGEYMTKNANNAVTTTYTTEANRLKNLVTKYFIKSSNLQDNIVKNTVANTNLAKLNTCLGN